MRFHLPTLLGAVVLGLLPAALPAAAPEGVTSFTLPNGLTGVVIEDHRAPVVTQMVWYRVGSADEPPGQSGIAHFLEHLMFKATDTLADGEFSQVVAENGGDENAFTTSGLHRLLPAHRRRPAGPGDGDGGGPDGRTWRRGRHACRRSATW